MNFFTFLLLTIFVGRNFTFDWEANKIKFKLKFNDLQEDQRRQTIWRKNVEKINIHNLEYAKGFHTYKMSINKFAHLEDSEFIAMHTGYKRINTVTTSKTTTKSTTTSSKSTTKLTPTTTPKFATTSLFSLPSYVNWISTIMVGPIKDQGKNQMI